MQKVATAAIALTVLLSLLFSPVSGHTAPIETSWYQPTLFSAYGAVNSVNAFNSDDIYALFTSSPDEADYYGFGITIPDDAVVTGISVEVEAHSDGRDLILDLGRYPNVILSMEAKSLDFSSGADSTIVAGGPEDLWGGTFTSADIADLMVIVCGGGGMNNGNVYVDQIRVKIFSEIAPVPEPSTLALLAIGTASLAAIRRRKSKAETGRMGWI